MKNKLLKIIEHYGVLPQLKYFQSEVFELNEAIITREIDWKIIDTTAKDIERDEEHIAEEIADVMVMLEQFRYYYDIKNETIERIMEEKIERQLKRIEKEDI